MNSHTKSGLSFMVCIISLCLIVTLWNKCSDIKYKQPIKDSISQRKSYTEKYLYMHSSKYYCNNAEVAAIECMYETLKVLKEINSKLGKNNHIFP